MGPGDELPGSEFPLCAMMLVYDLEKLFTISVPQFAHRSKRDKDTIFLISLLQKGKHLIYEIPQRLPHSKHFKFNIPVIAFCQI